MMSTTPEVRAAREPAQATARSVRPIDRPPTGSTTVSPECRDQKHANCDSDALDPLTDEIGQCDCDCHAGKSRA